MDDPLGTLTAGGTHSALCEPFIIHSTHHGERPGHPVSQPTPCITGAHRGELALIESFIVKYYATGGARPVTQPIDTISTRDRFGLVQPQADGHRLEILFRMLQPHELAAAMSFPAGYQFTGTRESQVKQIGNAVPVLTAEALCLALLDP